jgi:hypothetical protein
VATAPEIQRQVLDRVAVRWIDAPPPLVATLMFRVGPIDERLKTSGITHLAEHLALHPLRDRDHPFNGAVHVDHTAFWAAGTEEQVFRFLRDLSKTLTDLPTERLEAEARVLAAESQAMTGSHYTDLLRTWYGPNGPGLLGAPEFGLDWIGPAHVGAWTTTHFTSANALLTLTGPPPEALRINLPVGEYVPVVMPPEDVGFRPDNQVKLRSQPAGVCLGTVAERSVPLVMAVSIVGNRLRDRLRHDLGLVYSIQASYEPLSANEAFVYLGTDCDRAHNEAVSAAFMDQVRQFAADGPTPEELDRVRDEPGNRARPDPSNLARNELNRLGHDELLRHPLISQRDADEMRAGATAEEVRRAFAAAVARCLVIPAPEYDEGLSVRPRRNQQTFLGRQYRARRQTGGGIARLIVADEGLSALADGRWVSIPFRDLVLVTRPAPGIRHLYSRTGSWMELDAASYWRGDRVIQQIDGVVPPDVLIPVGRR